MNLKTLRPRTFGRYSSNGHDQAAWVEMSKPAESPTRNPGTVLLWTAAGLLLLLAGAQGYVSWKAQFTFINAAKHVRLASTLEALGLDTGAVIFALLGLANARGGRPAKLERTLNLGCALGSMAMNLLGADLASPRSIAVYVLPALLYATCSDRLIAVAGHAAGVTETSVWRFAGVGLLYGLRALVAFPSTMAGLRRKLLAATPLPAALEFTALPPTTLTPIPARPVISQPGSGRAQLRELYNAHPARDETPAAQLARELHQAAGMTEGSARNAITAFRQENQS